MDGRIKMMMEVWQHSNGFFMVSIIHYNFFNCALPVCDDNLVAGWLAGCLPG